MKKLAFSLFFAAAFLCRAALVSAVDPADSPEPALSDADKLYGLSLFWKEVSYNFANFGHVPGLDWDKSYQEFIPRVLAAENAFEYYRELQRFSALLKDGHTGVYPPKSIVDKYMDYPRVMMREIEHRAYVDNVDSALVDSLPVGSEIVAVDGVRLPDFLRAKVFPCLSVSTEQSLWYRGICGSSFGFLTGASGSRVALDIVTITGKRRRVSITRDCNKVGGMHLVRAINRGGKTVDLKWLENNIPCVALNTFNDLRVAEDFIALLPELRRAAGLLIDLRSNTGGNSLKAAEIARYLTGKVMLGAGWTTPVHNAAFKAWGRPGGYADGKACNVEAPDTLVPEAGKNLNLPIVVLIGPRTESSSENFLVYLDPLENATLVGEPTSGSTGNPLFMEMPGGGKALICTKHEYFPDGREFVGRGIQPDVLVRALPEELYLDLTPEEMLYGRDPVRARGLEVLKEKIEAR